MVNVRKWSSAQEGVGARIFLIGPDKDKFHYSVKFIFPITNNMVEYEALFVILEPGLKDDMVISFIYIYITSISLHIRLCNIILIITCSNLIGSDTTTASQPTMHHPKNCEWR